MSTGHKIMTDNQKILAELEQIYTRMFELGIIFTCSYCGGKYSPLPQHFEAHVMVCPKHPFAAAKKTIEQLKDELDEKNTFLRLRG